MEISGKLVVKSVNRKIKNHVVEIVIIKSKNVVLYDILLLNWLDYNINELKLFLLDNDITCSF